MFIRKILYKITYVNATFRNQPVNYFSYIAAPKSPLNDLIRRTNTQAINLLLENSTYIATSA